MLAMVGWLFLVLALLIAALGAAVLVLGRRRGRALRDLRARGVRTTGTVVRLVAPDLGRGADIDMSIAHVPVVAFRLPDGREVEAVAQYGAGRPAALPGRTVEILYDPILPNRVVVAHGGSDGRLFVGAMGCLGAALLVFGLFVAAVVALIGLTIGFPG